MRACRGVQYPREVSALSQFWSPLRASDGAVAIVSRACYAWSGARRTTLNGDQHAVWACARRTAELTWRLEMSTRCGEPGPCRAPVLPREGVSAALVRCQVRLSHLARLLALRKPGRSASRTRPPAAAAVPARGRCSRGHSSRLRSGAAGRSGIAGDCGPVGTRCLWGRLGSRIVLSQVRGVNSRRLPPFHCSDILGSGGPDGGPRPPVQQTDELLLLALG